MTPDHHDLPLGLRLLMLAGVAGGATGPLDHLLDRVPSAVIAAVLAGAPAPSTTYYYRTSGGARGSSTDAGSIPAGAVVERVT